MIEIKKEVVKKAYKKLKASVYYDKTLSLLRYKIAAFEGKRNSLSLDNKFNEMSRLLNSEDEWDSYVDKLCSKIEIACFPKKLSSKSTEIITNYNDSNCNIEEEQYHIDTDVELQIFGILWVIYIGAPMDNDIYEHSYGNRLLHSKIHEEEGYNNYSPKLFKPYFSQYEGWRDYALDQAQNEMKKGNDVLILTLDLKRYFYSIDFSKELFDIINLKYNPNNEVIMSRLNELVFKVIERYNVLIRKYNDEFKGNMLPIGFFPSNILSNWYLKDFDNAIINHWNPVYFGRYVDDIIIVDKVKKDSEVQSLIEKGATNDIIQYFLCGCKNDKGNNCSANKNILIYDKNIFSVNIQYTYQSKEKLTFTDKKIKLFYFKSNCNDALITCFRNEIASNKSEFRYMPEEENIFDHDDLSGIFNLKSGGVNKLREIEGISIDKFSLSKFIGKYLKIGSLIYNKKEKRFQKVINHVFDDKTLLDNYTLWEKIILIYVSENNFEGILDFYRRIVSAIDKIKVNNNIKTLEILIKETLHFYLIEGIVRASSICWTKASNDILKEIENNESDYSSAFYKERRNYCVSRMYDKSTMPFHLDVILKDKEMRKLSEKEEVNFSDFDNVLNYAKRFSFNTDYHLYPYIIKPQEIEFSIVLNNIFLKEDNLKCIMDKVAILYSLINYNNDHNILIGADVLEFQNEFEEMRLYAVKVGTEYHEKFRVAVANAKVNENDFTLVLSGKKNRSFERYKHLKDIVNQSILSNASLLIMPENYVPFEWLPLLANICAKNKIAMVTGVEHVCYKNQLVNLTATILPFEQDDYCFSHIFFHNKVHYSPEEKKVITSYGFTFKEGNSYEIFNWKDLWFPVYCCYELASIRDRSIFQSYADLLIAIEWNKDTNYYSNIMESLDRDLHCYCAQVNTSNYGDSRIVRPSKSVLKDIVRTKGGENATVLIGTIDVKKLRSFQIKGYDLQQMDKSFKPTPPQFNVSVVRMKINRILWTNLTKNNKL